MTEIKKGDWVEVTPDGDYVFTGPGSIGRVTKQFEYEREEYCDVKFHIVCPIRGNRDSVYTDTFYIKKSQLKVIDEETAMKKIVEAHL